MRTALLAVLVAALPAGLASAQSVLVVDASGGAAFLDIQDAVDAAVDGDLVLVRAGLYDGFEIAGKGLVVSADSNAEVEIFEAVRVRDVPSGSEVVLSGLEIGITTFLHGTTLTISDCVGPVLVQDTELQRVLGTAGAGPLAVARTSTSVTFDSCRIDRALGGADLNGTWGALLVEDVAYAVVHASELTGSVGAGAIAGITAGPGTPALDAAGTTTLVVTGSVLTAGDGGDGGLFQGGDGGAALVLRDASVAIAYDSLLVAGEAGDDFVGSNPGQPGVESSVASTASLQEPVAFARRFEAAPVLRDGETTAIVFEGQPFDFVWQLVGTELPPLSVYLPEVLGAIQTGGVPVLIRFRGLLDASGQKALNVTLSGTGLDYLPLVEQALMYNATEEFVVSNPRSISFVSSTL